MLRGPARFRESHIVERRRQAIEHYRAAAQHEAIVVDRQWRQADIADQLAVFEQGRDTSVIAERFARDRRVVNQLVANLVTEPGIVAQCLRDQALVAQFVGITAAVHEDDAVETLVDFGILDDRQKWRQPGAGAQQAEVLAGEKIVIQQRARRFLADEQLVADANVLQARGQGAVRYLDTVELEMILVVRARHAVER